MPTMQDKKRVRKARYSKLVNVTVLKGFQGYAEGERCSWKPGIAEALVKTGLAKYTSELDRAKAEGGPAVSEAVNSAIDAEKSQSEQLEAATSRMPPKMKEAHARVRK